MAESSHRKYLKRVTVVSTFGGLLFGYDTGVINGALAFMARPDQLNLTPAVEGFVASGLLFGAAIGSFFGGRLSDAEGRRKMLLCLAVIFFFAAIGCSLSPTAGILIACRFVLGLAVGGASVTVPAYLAEMAPADRRGRMVTQNELMIVTGQLLAFILNAILGVTFGEVGHIWRYMLALASIPAVVLWFGMLVMPESPRWLLLQGRVSDAMQVLKKIRDERMAIAELNEIQDSIDSEKHLDKAGYKDLATPWIRRIVFIGMGVSICQQISGVNSIMYYGTQILTQAGFSTEAALIGNIANGTISVAATIFGMWLMTRHGRRPLIMTGPDRHDGLPLRNRRSLEPACWHGDAAVRRPRSDGHLPVLPAGLPFPGHLAAALGALPAAHPRHGHGLRRPLPLADELLHRLGLPVAALLVRPLGYVLHLRGHRPSRPRLRLQVRAGDAWPHARADRA